MKQPIIIALTLQSFVLAFFIFGCRGPLKIEEDININIDSVYLAALKVVFNGKCFYNPLPPEQIEDTTNNKNVLDESYVYFSKRFENFIIDSTLEFDHKELNELIKKPEFLEVDSFDLTSFDNKTFIEASEAIEASDFNDLSEIGFQEIQKNKLFSGHIMFSKPLIKRHSDTSNELFIRVVKIIDSPRNCYVRLMVKDNAIVEASELDFRTRLIFR
jgi:hypothetical protein